MIRVIGFDNGRPGRAPRGPPAFRNRKLRLLLGLQFRQKTEAFHETLKLLILAITRRPPLRPRLCASLTHVRQLYRLYHGGCLRLDTHISTRFTLSVMGTPATPVFVEKVIRTRRPTEGSFVDGVLGSWSQYGLRDSPGEPIRQVLCKMVKVASCWVSWSRPGRPTEQLSSDANGMILTTNGHPITF